MSAYPDSVPLDSITGLLEAFTTYLLVALGEAHWLQQEADFIAGLLRHPDFPRTVRLIGVEFGNARFQPVIDRFLAGEAISEAELRCVWRNVGGAGHAFESPIYAQFFHNVRAVNQSLSWEQQLRVLLGDPPADCQTGQGNPAVWKGQNERDAHYAAVVEQHVLAAQQRTLLIAGAGHFGRVSDARPAEGNVTQRLEQRYPGAVFVVAPHGHH